MDDDLFDQLLANGGQAASNGAQDAAPQKAHPTPQLSPPTSWSPPSAIASPRFPSTQQIPQLSPPTPWSPPSAIASPTFQSTQPTRSPTPNYTPPPANTPTSTNALVPVKYLASSGRIKNGKTNLEDLKQRHAAAVRRAMHSGAPVDLCVQRITRVNDKIDHQGESARTEIEKAIRMTESTFGDLEGGTMFVPGYGLVDNHFLFLGGLGL
jgi:hypothetical protein